MDLYIFLLFLFSITLPETFGANILAVFPHTSYNHFKATSKLVIALEKKGHNVTFVSPYQIEVDGYKNINEISIHDIVEPINRFTSDFFKNHEDPTSYWSKLQYAEEMGLEYGSQVLNNENVTQLINSQSVFDLVLIEHLSAESLSIFSYIFKCPLVVLLSEPLSTFYENYFFNNIQWKQFNNIRNAHHYVIKELYREWVILPKQNEIIKRILPEAPDIREVLYNTSLVFIPSYPTLGNLVPKYPNVKQIGGFHIDNQQQLSADIDKFLNDSQEGVIVISDDIKQSNLVFLNTSGQFLQDKLWKFNLYGGEILGHSNVKLLIGNGDIYETAYAVSNEVPVINILRNRWFQQFLVDTLVEEGVVLEVPMNKLEMKNLGSSINELFSNNSRYLKKAKLASQIISQKQISPPIDEAIFWIEYVIMFQGAPHLRSYDLQLQLKNHLVYIIIILVIIDILLFLLFYWIIKHLPKLCCIPNKMYNTVHRSDNSQTNILYFKLDK